MNYNTIEKIEVRTEVELKEVIERNIFITPNSNNISKLLRDVKELTFIDNSWINVCIELAQLQTRIQKFESSLFQTKNDRNWIMNDWMEIQRSLSKKVRA